MIDIDLIIQNIEDKIKGLEELSFDDEPKKFFCTPIRAVKINNSADFKRLECQNIFLPTHEVVTRKTSNQYSSTSSKFSKSYAEFLKTLNEDMKKFKEQRRRNESCEKFLGKNAKMFIRNEKLGQTNKMKNNEDIIKSKSLIKQGTNDALIRSNEQENTRIRRMPIDRESIYLKISRNNQLPLNDNQLFPQSKKLLSTSLLLCDFRFYNQKWDKQHRLKHIQLRFDHHLRKTDQIDQQYPQRAYQHR